VSRPRLSDEVATHVREQVISGALAAGTFIRPERVAEELDVSATPAREGLLSLRSEGFLEVVPRRGFVVLPLSDKDIRDTFDAQGLLGGELAARAAAAATPELVADLTALQERLRYAAEEGDLDRVEQLNFEFHRAVYRHADAPKISWLLGATLGYAPRRQWASIEGWPALTLHDHEDILDALRRKDPDAAREAMSRHIVEAGRALLAHRATVS
jgi:DNA-binding GntR family transcriptional regulator